jgi:hypothetical protein
MNKINTVNSDNAGRICNSIDYFRGLTINERMCITKCLNDVLQGCNVSEVLRITRGICIRARELTELNSIAVFDGFSALEDMMNKEIYGYDKKEICGYEE